VPPLVPYRNYVTHVGRRYKPHLFKTREALNRILRGKCLINQSSLVLGDEEIETLCLGLNYIPSCAADEKAAAAASIQIERQLALWSRSINLSLHFGADKPGSISHHKRGWLSKYVPSTWCPPAQSWSSDPAINVKALGLPDAFAISGPLTPPAIMAALEGLAQRDDVHILKSDKGRNVVIWAVADYDREALRQLTDTSCYAELTEDECRVQLLRLQTESHWLAENLRALDHISEAEYRAIIDTAPECAEVYFLPKTHKPVNATSETFSGRIIAATFTSVHHLLDKYITEVTAPLLPRIPGSLRDTLDLLDRLPKGALPAGAEIVTVDVVGLYPSISWPEGIAATVAFYTDNFPFLVLESQKRGMRPPPRPHLFKAILELVLRNSYVTFKGKRFFHQLKGTAMGTCISVFFANCYMYSVTRHIIENPPDWLLLFLRFIDDIIIIVKAYQKQAVDDLIEAMSNLYIGYECTPPQKDQPFLDITLAINRDTNLIETAPYWKPTASGSYLHPSSNHPQHVIDSIPYAQFLRLRRISSSMAIFKKAALRLRDELHKAGYDRKKVRASYDRVYKATSAALPAVSGRNIGADTFKLILPFNKNTDWRRYNRALSNVFGGIRAHYAAKDPASATTRLLDSKSATIVSANERSINDYFSKAIKRPRASR
jgi:hypothetical protein